MEGRPRGRNYRTLFIVVGLGIVYGVWLYTQHTITGTSRFDGALGVVLGLFICSRPAANMLDLLFSQRSDAPSAEDSLPGWLMLNGAVLFAGWLVITIGATRLVAYRG